MVWVMGFVVGVDTGGTFTDTVVLDTDGTVTIGKKPSTPPEFVAGVEDSVGEAASILGRERAALLDETDMFLHGTTIVVNAIVTGSGARIGLLTTKGFGDTVFIGRAQSRVGGLTTERIHHFAEAAKPAPLIPTSKRLVREIPERVDYSGAVVAPLDEDAARRAIEELVAEGVDALAVCLLWSFTEPKHERRIRDIAAEVAPDVPVTLSSELVPKMGEYERMTTTGFNAAMSTIAEDYLSRLSASLTSDGLTSAPLIMQGNGGVVPVDQAMRTPVNLIGSGPAGGVLGAKLLADALGMQQVICTDVGGTSFDVGLIVDGEPLITPRAIVNQHSLYLPLVDVVSIGAGGGSIARAETAGETARLRVGPQSAGARPGPVCYGVGGTMPTVTDADLVLGMIDPAYFLGGAMTLDVEAAREAIRVHVAEPLDMSIEQAAAGIVEVADNHMADLMRQVTVERGFDPRDFTAFLYGGGGPLHGTAYAAKLGLKSMVVPGGALASVFSAWGIASADIHHAYEQSHPMAAPLDPTELMEVLGRLEDQAHRQLDEDGVPAGQRVLQRFVEMRYAMQTNEIGIAVPKGDIDERGVEDIVTTFESAYERLYGRGSGFREAGIELTAFRVHAYGRLAKPNLRRHQANGATSPRSVGTRSIYWYEKRERIDTPIYRGADLATGMTVDGPAVVELPTTTVAVRPDQRLAVDETHNYLITEQ